MVSTIRPATAMNAERILALADHIANLDERYFTMDDWINRDPRFYRKRSSYFGLPSDNREAAAECGAVACIAGWAVLIFAAAADEDIGVNIATEAQRLLGLDDDQATALFTPLEWDQIYERQDQPEVLSCSCQTVTTHDAARTLRELAATGRVHWRRNCVCQECGPAAG